MTLGKWPSRPLICPAIKLLSDLTDSEIQIHLRTTPLTSLFRIGTTYNLDDRPFPEPIDISRLNAIPSHLAWHAIYSSLYLVFHLFRSSNYKRVGGTVILPPLQGWTCHCLIDSFTCAHLGSARYCILSSSGLLATISTDFPAARVYGSWSPAYC